MEQREPSQREFREKGCVSNGMPLSLRPYGRKAVRSSDAQLFSPLPSTLRFDRLTGSSSTV
jgi:hypothetical protein